MLTTTVGHKDHFYAPSQNPGGLTVFSDVDNTLVMGGGHDISYNQALTNGMKNSGIREMYLCTSMSLSDASVNSEIKAQGDPYETREDIIKHYENQGIKVLGAFTTPDLVLYAGQQAMRNGTFPSLKKLLDSTKEDLHFPPEEMERLSSKLEEAYAKFSQIMSKDSVMGQYYSEIVAPNYVRGETVKLSKDSDYQALVIIDKAFDLFYKDEINKLLESKGYEESKTLMAEIVQTESAQHGVPISKYMMFDDSKFIVEDITKAARNEHDAAGINIIMTQRTSRTAANACITEQEITSGISNAMYNMGLVPLVKNDLKDVLSNINDKIAEVERKTSGKNYLSNLVRRNLSKRREQRKDALTTLVQDLTNAGNDLSSVAAILHNAATNPILNRAVWTDFTQRLAASSAFMSRMDALVTQRNQMQLPRVPISSSHPAPMTLSESTPMQATPTPPSQRRSYNPLFIATQKEAVEQKSQVKDNIRKFEALAAAAKEETQHPRRR